MQIKLRPTKRALWLGAFVAVVLLVAGGFYLIWKARTNHLNETFTVDDHFVQVQHGKQALTAPSKKLVVNQVTHGLQLLPPADEQGNLWLQRAATAYYHRDGPVGRVMAAQSLFRPPAEKFWNDARLPASLIGLAAPPGALGSLAQLWSEPPLAVVGMTVGTPASYAGLLQQVDFFERSQAVADLSLPPPGQAPAAFTFIADAMKRGAHVRVHVGPERPALDAMNCEKFYRVILVETSRGDGFNVCKEMLTQEAMASLLRVLADDGVIAFHVSNRYFDLAPVVTNAALSLNLIATEAKDDGKLWRRTSSDETRYTSTWVLVTRTPAALARVTALPPGMIPPDPIIWTPRPVPKGRPWTDTGEQRLQDVMR